MNLFATFLLLLAACATPALHAAESSTLKRWRETGRITLGLSDASMPISYLDAQGQHVGYHVELCRRVVNALRARFELPELKVIVVPTQIATRIALLNNQSIDIECAHNPINSSGLAQGLLSHSTMVSQESVMTTVDKAQLTLATLGGKAIGLAAGGTAVRKIRLAARDTQLRINEVYARQAKDVFALLEDGRVDAVALPKAYLMALRATSAQPSRYVLLDGELVSEPMAMMFRLADEDLHAAANEVLESMMKSGEMQRLFEKWFLQPIPGLPAGLGFALPAVLRGWWDKPGSEMLQL